MRVLAALCAVVLAACLLGAMVSAPSGEGLATLVDRHSGPGGVSNPVTAVLLDFRAWDTLLESGVLLLAVICVFALDRGGAREPPISPQSAGPVLAVTVALTVPVTVVVGVYLLWAGAHAPGGAFQAGAFLAAAGVLARLSGRLPPLLPPTTFVRIGLVFGFLAFLGIAVAMPPLLDYPPGHAGLWVMVIEVALAPSIALVLVSLFLGAGASGEGR